MKKILSKFTCLMIALTMLAMPPCQVFSADNTTAATATAASTTAADMTNEQASGDQSLSQTATKDTPLAKDMATQEIINKSDVPIEDVLVNLDYKGAELVNVVRTLSYTYGLNLVATKPLTGTVTMSLNNVPLDQALEAILSTNGYTYTRKGHIIYVFEGQTTVNVGMVTEAIRLKYLLAGDTVKYIEKAVSGKGDIKALEPTNSIVITDFPNFMAKIKKVIETIDVPPVQVIIEAKVLDVKRNDLDSLGAKFSFDYTPLGANSGLFNRKVTNTATGPGTGQETTSGAFDLTSAVGTALNPILTAGTFDLKGFQITQAQINALVENKHTNILAAPSIATLNGQEAKIVIGERYPYKEKTQTTTGTTETTKFVDIGTILTVTPYVSPDGHVTMVVHPEVSSFASALSDGSPRITTREATATIRVQDAQTIMIGGLVSTDNKKTVDRIPFLGSLPVVGYAFSSRNKDYEERELVIFLTPHIIPVSSPDAKEIRYGESKEVFINIQGVGEKALVSQLLISASNLENNEGTISERKSRKVRMSEAADMYSQIASQFPHSKSAPDSLLRAASIYYHEFKEYDHAKALAQDFLDRYPEDPRADKARAMIVNSEKKGKWRDTLITRVRDWETDHEKKVKQSLEPKPKKKGPIQGYTRKPKAPQATATAAAPVKKEYKPLFDFRKKTKTEGSTK